MKTKFIILNWVSVYLEKLIKYLVQPFFSYIRINEKLANFDVILVAPCFVNYNR